MRHGCLFLLFLFAFPSYAKVGISIAKFEDKTVADLCPGSATAKSEIHSELQERLIAAMLKLERFEIQEREIRPLSPRHRLIGSLRTLEVCPRAGGRIGQRAEIVLDLQLLDANGSITHVFTSNAKATSAARGQAGRMAIAAAVTELARRINGAIPGKASTRLVYKGRGRNVADNEYEVQMIRRPNAGGR